MNDSNNNELKMRLKQMILEECDIDHIQVENFADDVQIFSDASGLGLDSLDALQISVGLQKKFAVRLPDSKSFRRHVTTIEELADYILTMQQSAAPATPMAKGI
ncbi:MAG: phosphopantetheine-binding protein [Thermodesulfobacteriota bacterium]|nr:phosphopantetheine-binding protein [Thermodesulfobacteriota bacterium]